MKILSFILLLVTAVTAHAQESTTNAALNDPLLDRLVGDWSVERTFPSGRVTKNIVHAEWVLQHQFVELHYQGPATPSRYEARVLIGYDQLANRYVCHWADSYGGTYSADGFAPRQDKSNAMEFTFEFHDGRLTNRFAFEPASGTWKSTIWQTEKGEWTLFCEDQFTRLR